MNYPHNCTQKVRKELLDANPDIESIRFELDNIKNSQDLGNPEAIMKTGQRIFCTLKGKKKEEKSFVAHVYCPFCGEKFNN